MDTNKDDSIKVTVYVFMWDANVHKLVIVEGLSYDTTIKELKLKVCSLARDIGFGQLDPDKANLMWYLRYLEDDMTLGSLSSSPSFDNMYLLPHITLTRWQEESEEEGRWLNICTQVRKEEEEAQQEEDNTNNDCSSLSREKRPKINGQLPFAQFGGLVFDGGCLEFKCFGSHVPVVSKIETTAYSVYTAASVVILAPNDRIFNTLLSSLPSHSKSDYLVLRVSWDLLSYVFLRQVRRRYPELPFVAVTDLDPHHLDLLTFLDTPPMSVIDCYGWHLGLDADEDTFFVHEFEFVDIAWLGLRPSQLLELKRCDSFDDQAPSSAPDFCRVIRMLEVNPYLRCKKTWLEELECLKRYGKTVLLEPLEDEFISEKLSQQDWK